MKEKMKKLDLRGRLSIQYDFEGDDPPYLDFLLDKNPLFRGVITADEIWRMFDYKRIRMRIEVIE